MALISVSQQPLPAHILYPTFGTWPGHCPEAFLDRRHFGQHSSTSGAVHLIWGSESTAAILQWPWSSHLFDHAITDIDESSYSDGVPGYVPNIIRKRHQTIARCCYRLDYHLRGVSVVHTQNTLY